MKEDYQIVYVEESEKITAKFIEARIQHHIKEQAGDPEFQRLCFALYSSDEEIVGGLIGSMISGLNIKMNIR